MTHDVLTQRQAAYQAQALTPIHDAGTIETKLWQEEHDWLHRLLNNPKNVSPTFRFPDLISACVSLVFKHSDADWRIFGILRTEFALRQHDAPRRRQAMWRSQYQLLLDLQRSALNQHPHPMHKLDQLTSACVALCRDMHDPEAAILRQARENMADRSRRKVDLLL